MFPACVSHYKMQKKVDNAFQLLCPQKCAKHNASYFLFKLFYSADEVTATRPTVGQHTRYVYVLSMRSTDAIIQCSTVFFLTFIDDKAFCKSVAIL